MFQQECSLCVTTREFFDTESVYGRVNLARPVVMDGREKNALNEVDRIARAVDRLRDLLLAATKADLRAVSKQQAAVAPPE
jgi:hypothetical protein